MQPDIRQTALGVAAFVLWIATVILGMQSLYALMQLFPLMVGLLGGSLNAAERVVPILAFILGLVLMVVVIGTGEYHRQRVGRAESWKVFGVTIAVELAILFLYYFVFNVL